jgi:hypothetical protein
MTPRSVQCRCCVARPQASFVPFQLSSRRRAFLMGLGTKVGFSTAGWDDRGMALGAWLFPLPKLPGWFVLVRPGFLFCWGVDTCPGSRWRQQAFSIRKRAVQLALILDPKRSAVRRPLRAVASFLSIFVRSVAFLFCLKSCSPSFDFSFYFNLSTSQYLLPLGKISLL